MPPRFTLIRNLVFVFGCYETEVSNSCADVGNAESTCLGRKAKAALSASTARKSRNSLSCRG
jgi:hypothetical protein